MLAILVDRHFKGVDLGIVGDHAVETIDIPLLQRLHRGADLLFDQTPHLQHAGADIFELHIKLLGNVIRHERPRWFSASSAP
ncbi:hypothetical protein D3C71_1953110 [compost metagenome]